MWQAKQEPLVGHLDAVGTNHPLFPFGMRKKMTQ
jgi:hypothetical protein